MTVLICLKTLSKNYVPRPRPWEFPAANRCTEGHMFVWENSKMFIFRVDRLTGRCYLKVHRESTSFAHFDFKAL